MSPGYVCSHPRLLRPGRRTVDDAGRLAWEVKMVAPLPEAIERVTRRASGWQSWIRRGSGDREWWDEPFELDRPHAVTTVTLRLPIDRAELPKPRYTTTRGPVGADVDVAKRAVQAVCSQLNTQLREIVTALDESTKGQR